MKKWIVGFLLITFMSFFISTVFASFPLDPIKCPVCGQMASFANQTKEDQFGGKMYLFKCIKMHYFWVRGD